MSKQIHKSKNSLFFKISNFLRDPMKALTIFLLLIGKANADRYEYMSMRRRASSSPLASSNTRPHGVMDYLDMQEHFGIAEEHEDILEDDKEKIEETITVVSFATLANDLMSYLKYGDFDKAYLTQKKMLKTYPSEESYGFLVYLKTGLVSHNIKLFTEDLDQLHAKLSDKPTSYWGAMGKAFYTDHLVRTEHDITLIKEAYNQLEEVKTFATNPTEADKIVPYQKMHEKWGVINSNFFMTAHSKIYKAAVDVSAMLRFTINDETIADYSPGFRHKNTIEEAAKYSFPLFLAKGIMLDGIDIGRNNENELVTLIYNQEAKGFYIYKATWNTAKTKLQLEQTDYAITYEHGATLLQYVVGVLTHTGELMVNETQFVNYLRDSANKSSVSNMSMAILAGIATMIIGAILAVYLLFKPTQAQNNLLGSNNRQLPPVNPPTRVTPQPGRSQRLLATKSSKKSKNNKKTKTIISQPSANNTINNNNNDTTSFENTKSARFNMSLGDAERTHLQGQEEAVGTTQDVSRFAAPQK